MHNSALFTALLKKCEIKLTAMLWSVAFAEFKENVSNKVHNYDVCWATEFRVNYGIYLLWFMGYRIITLDELWDYNTEIIAPLTMCSEVLWSVVPFSLLSILFYFFRTIFVLAFVTAKLWNFKVLSSSEILLQARYESTILSFNSSL